MFRLRNNANVDHGYRQNYWSPFILDFKYNIENYESFQRSPLITSGDYFFVSYVLLFGFLGVLAVITGYKNLWQRNRHLLYIFASFPILLSIYLSTGGLVLNWITSITIPFIIPVMAIGAHTMFSHLSLKLGNKVAAACSLIFSHRRHTHSEFLHCMT